MPPVTSEEKTLQRRVADAVKTLQHTGRPQFLGFLSEREQQLAAAQLHKSAFSAFVMEGGYQNAERRMLCVFDEEPPPLPIVTAFLRVKGDGQRLCHRDYLGALLACGLRRDRFGDIAVQDTGAVLYLQASVFPFVRETLATVGPLPVQVEQCGAPPEAGPARGGTQHTASVASLRLDGVLAAMLSLSRSGAAALIVKGAVQVNHLAVQAVSYAVQQGDVFSVRGRGRYQLTRLAGESKKGRQRIEYTVF